MLTDVWIMIYRSKPVRVCCDYIFRHRLHAGMCRLVVQLCRPFVQQQLRYVCYPNGLYNNLYDTMCVIPTVCTTILVVCVPITEKLDVVPDSLPGGGVWPVVCGNVEVVNALWLCSPQRLMINFEKNQCKFQKLLQHREILLTFATPKNAMPRWRNGRRARFRCAC